MRKIKIFHPLRLPHLDGGRANTWCTYSSDNGFIYLLNNNRYEVGNLMDININIHKDIHFDTEDECHRQACAYYTRYGQEYPYMVEWSAVMWKTNNSVPVTNTTVESQVMRFT